MPEFPNTPATLANWQEYIKQMKLERGFNTDDKIKECFLLVEEIGELFKAIRKSEGWRIDSNAKAQDNVAHELADCLIFLLSIANQHDIDVEVALREKEEINNTRTWVKKEKTA